MIGLEPELINSHALSINPLAKTVLVVVLSPTADTVFNEASLNKQAPVSAKLSFK